MLESGMSDRAKVSAAGMRIVRLLVGTPPQTVADLIKATGVTRTAVTEQLNELVSAGYLARSTERLSGRGRPRHLYSVTDAALMLLFASNQRLLVPAIWRAVNNACDQRTIDRIIAEVSRSLRDPLPRANHCQEAGRASEADDRITSG